VSQTQEKEGPSFKDVGKVFRILKAIFVAYRMAEIVAVLPLVLCWFVLTLGKLLLPPFIVNKTTEWTEMTISYLLGCKAEEVELPSGRTESYRYSVAGSLDTDFKLPPGLLAATHDKESNTDCFPCKTSICYGNAAFLAMCMKLAYEKWPVVQKIVDKIWKTDDKRRLQPSFVAAFSFGDLNIPTAVDVSGKVSKWKKRTLGSDAFVMEVSAPGGAAGSGKALVLAFRGTEPTELVDFQSDFDVIPNKGDKGTLHPGFLMSLGLDWNLRPLQGCDLQYSVFPQACYSNCDVANGDRDTVKGRTSDQRGPRLNTPYELICQKIIRYMTRNPEAQLFVTGHSLGGALAAVFTAAFLFDKSKEVQPLHARLGATYTFGQPRVGDYLFCSKLVNALITELPAPAGTEDKLPLELMTGRYVRVCNTYDIVTHIPPSYGQVYQHTGALAYLKASPREVEFLGEMPPFVWQGVWVSSLKKFRIYTKLFFGFNQDEWSEALKNWKGQENWLRLPFRLAACILPGIIGGLSDHMPGDYYQQVVNSDKEAWQPLKRNEESEGIPLGGAAATTANRIAAAGRAQALLEHKKGSVFSFSHP